MLYILGRSYVRVTMEYQRSSALVSDDQGRFWKDDGKRRMASGQGCTGTVPGACMRTRVPAGSAGQWVLARTRAGARCCLWPHLLGRSPLWQAWQPELLLGVLWTQQKQEGGGAACSCVSCCFAQAPAARGRRNQGVKLHRGALPLDCCGWARCARRRRLLLGAQYTVSPKKAQRVCAARLAESCMPPGARVVLKYRYLTDAKHGLFALDLANTSYRMAA